MDCFSLNTFRATVCAPLNCMVRAMMRASLGDRRELRTCLDVDDRAYVRSSPIEKRLIPDYFHAYAEHAYMGFIGIT